MNSAPDTLTRNLSARHIRFIALGSAIGTGLFYGSAEAIRQAGPSVLVAYLLGGAVIYIVLRSLGRWRYAARWQDRSVSTPRST